MKVFTFLSLFVGLFLLSIGLSFGANLTIGNSGPSTANPGDLITYTITYSNIVSTLEENVVITDYLPDAANCTYYSSFPAGVYNSGLNQVTWNSTQIPGLASLDAGSGENTIQITLRVGKVGTGTTQSGLGYYLNASTVTLSSHAGIKSNQTATSIFSNTLPTLVKYDGTFKISQPGAGIKSATGSTLTYLVALTNMGNIYQKYSLTSSLFSGQNLDQSIQDLSGGTISETPFIAPGGSFFLHYVLNTPGGTKPNEYTRTKITATPNLYGSPQDALYNTFIYGGSYSSYELLSVYKIDTSDPVQSGSQLTYKIVISNVGSPLTDVRLTETYPSQTSFSSASSSTRCVTTGNNIWDFSLLPSGNTIITVTLNVDKGISNGTILNNTVAVSNNGTIYDTYTELTTVLSAPDLAITKTASVVDSPAGPGSTVNYTLTYTNKGNYTASGVVIKDNYDETYMNASNIGTGNNENGEITWNIPNSLIPGASGTINYSMTIKNNPLLFVKGSANIINSVVISSNLIDSYINDNTSSATVNVFVLPDLKIEEIANPTFCLVEQPITYTLSVSNIGKLDHTGGTYTVVDYLPAGATYISSTPAGGIYSSGTLTWTISDNLPVNETKNFTVTLGALPCPLVGNGTLSNRVTVNSNTYGDADNTNNEVVLKSNVIDKIPPTIICSGPISVNNDSGQCSAVVSLTTPTTADNCGILTVTNDHPSTTYPLGTTLVTWKVTDIHNNINTAFQNVTVTDNEKPVITAPANISVNNDYGICGATVLAGTATVTDNCSVGLLTGKRSDELELTAVYPVGSTTITWSFDDGHGNNATASQIVFVYDNTKPVTPVLADVNVGECSGTPTVPTTTDNCSGIITGTTTTIFPITAQGTTIVTWSFDDGNGNVTTAMQNVFVDDVTKPVMPVLADVNVGECSGTPTVPTTTDNCSGVITGTTTTIFPITQQGTTIVTWSFDDRNGNVTTALQNVLVDDVTKPVMPVLADVNVGECSGTPAVPTTTDNCSGVVTGTTTTIFPITAQGTTIVTWRFDDGNGNVTTAMQNVLVDDVTKPVTPVLADVNVGECSGTPAVPTTTDNCSGIITGTTSTIFPITQQGTTIVTWSFDDGNGNVTTALQNVVVDDITTPVLPVLADVNVGECSGTPPVPTTTDNCSGIITGTTTTIFPITVQGTTIVTWSFDDGNGNVTTALQNVMVDDVTPPLMPVLADVNVGECSGTPTVPTTTDNCSGIITGTTSTIFPITAQGTTIVTWSFDDDNGNVTTAMQNVVVDDVTKPVKPVLADVNVGECSGTPAVPTTTDNCSGIITGTTTTIFPITAQGTTIVTWSFDDGNGNVTTALQNVVVDDVTKPLKPVLADVNVGECSGTPAVPTTTDNCSGVVTGTTATIFPITAQGTTIVTWSFDDGNGNITTALQNVVVDDVTPPVTPVLADVNVGECSGTPTVPTTTDNCSGVIIGTTTTIFPITEQGTTIVTWSFDDDNGNVTTALQNVVVDDITKPVKPVLADLTIEKCSGTPPIPTTTDNCSGVVTGTTTTIFPIMEEGTTIVTWSFDDGNGNIKTAQQNVAVEDDTAPLITGTIADLTVEGCSAEAATPAVSTVSGLEALGLSISDPCTSKESMLVTSIDVTTGISPIIVTRTYTISDASDNATTYSHSILVVDTQKPVITCASPLASYASDNDVCTYQVSGTSLDPVTTDNCSVKSVTNDFNNAASLKDAVFPIGTTTVIWTVEDGSGNSATCSYAIVVADMQNPTVSCPIPASSYPSDNGLCAYKVPGINLDPIATADNCSVKSVTNDFNNASSLKDAVFTIGKTKVTWTVEDGSGNKTTCSIDVVVVDTQAPTIVCATLAASYPSNKPGQDLDPTFSDNCTIASIKNNYNDSASLKDAEFPLGTTIVTWTVTDASGNKANCSNIIVITDIQPPVINCASVPADGYPANEGVCTYKITGTTLDPTIENNEPGVQVTNSFNNSATLQDAEFQIGTTQVIWTVTDSNGNSATCTQTIKIRDTQNPTITCSANISAVADAGKCTASGVVLGTPITGDNCSIASVSNNAPDIFQLGTTIVTWTVTDGSGNIAICSQTVTVNGLPVAIDDVVSVDEDDQSSGNVMTNDLGICDLPVLVKAHTEPVNGVLTIASNGNYTYEPASNYYGTDSFTYQVCDLDGDCSTATVTITVKTVDDLPLAIDDKENLQLDGVLAGNVGGNDNLSGDGGNVWSLLDSPSNGTIVFNPDGTYIYTPNGSYMGNDSFTYELCDLDGDCSQGLVTITIEDVLLPNQILTPNGDGNNDTFIVLGIEFYPVNKLIVYNRWGNIVYQRNNYKNEWDGNSNVNKIGSNSLPIGTYYYLIDYGKDRHKTGFVYLDR